MRLLFLSLALVLSGLVAPGVALADSCWFHNGSLMRLQAQGQNRWFSYEAPRATLQSAGVQQGTLLFNGTNVNGWYSGTARVFSSACPGQPQEYTVSGPVGPNQTSVTLQGNRQVHNACRWTGAYTTDTLHFTYSHQC